MPGLSRSALLICLGTVISSSGCKDSSSGEGSGETGEEEVFTGDACVPGEGASKAATGPLVAVAATEAYLYAGGVANAIYQSTDAGQTFRLLKLPVEGQPFVQDIVAADRKVYVATAGDQAGFFVSVDCGATFERKHDGVVSRLLLEGTILYLTAGGGKILKTGDDGVTFDTFAIPETSTGVYSVALSGDTLYAATESKLAVSSDGGETFVSRPVSQSIYDMHADGSTLWLATSAGLMITQDAGESLETKYTYLPPGAISPSVSRVLVKGQDLYVSGKGLGISRDGGATFETRTKADGLGRNPKQVAIVGENVYVAVTEGLAVSRDLGATFFVEGGTSAPNDEAEPSAEASIVHCMSTNTTTTPNLTSCIEIHDGTAEQVAKFQAACDEMNTTLGPSTKRDGACTVQGAIGKCASIKIDGMEAQSLYYSGYTVELGQQFCGESQGTWTAF